MKALGTLVAALAGALACGGLLFGLGVLLVRTTNVGGLPSLRVAGLVRRSRRGRRGRRRRGVDRRPRAPLACLTRGHRVLAVKSHPSAVGEHAKTRSASYDQGGGTV